MWCQWVKSYLLKGKSFWKVKIPSSPSWTWRKLLQLRPLIQPFIKYKIGDGNSTSLWYDNWHPSGPLVGKYGNRIVYDSGLTDDAKVSTILHASNHWNFPITQTWELNEIRTHLPPLTDHNSTNTDSCMWTLTQNGVFSISSLWDQIRVKFPTIEWSHVVWFPSHIPKCSLISWLAIQKRLSTLLRIGWFSLALKPPLAAASVLMRKVMTICFLIANLPSGMRSLKNLSLLGNPNPFQILSIFSLLSREKI